MSAEACHSFFRFFIVVRLAAPGETCGVRSGISGWVVLFDVDCPQWSLAFRYALFLQSVKYRRGIELHTSHRQSWVQFCFPYFPHALHPSVPFVVYSSISPAPSLLSYETEVWAPDLLRISLQRRIYSASHFTYLFGFLQTQSHFLYDRSGKRCVASADQANSWGVQFMQFQSAWEI